MEEKIKELLDFLNTERPLMAPYSIDKLKRYYRVVSEGRAAHCFIVKADFINKSVGSVKAGDLMFPASWSQPAKHPRGKLFDRETWDMAFGEYSMKYLKD